MHVYGYFKLENDFLSCRLLNIFSIKGTDSAGQTQLPKNTDYSMFGWVPDKLPKLRRMSSSQM